MGKRGDDAKRLTMAFPSGYPRPMFGSLRGEPVVDPMAYGPFGVHEQHANYVSPPEREFRQPGREYVPPAAPARKKRKVKLGPVHHCKVVPMTLHGKRVRRRLCWDKHGHLVRNTAAGSKGGKGSARKRRVKCTLKCPKGSSPICKGGFRSAGKGRGGKVCRKWVCRRRKGR